MTTIQAQPSRAGKSDTDRAAYIEYIRAAVTLASSVSSHDRIKHDLEFPADRAESALVRRHEVHRRNIEAFRTAESIFLDGVTV